MGKPRSATRVSKSAEESGRLKAKRDQLLRMGETRPERLRANAFRAL